MRPDQDRGGGPARRARGSAGTAPSRPRCPGSRRPTSACRRWSEWRARPRPGWSGPAARCGRGPARDRSGPRARPRTRGSGRARPPPGSDGGPRKSISIVSCSAHRDRPARRVDEAGLRVRVQDDRPSREARHDGEGQARQLLAAGAQQEREARRTTLSRPVVMLASPSSTAALRTVAAGRTKVSNSWATPGRGSKAFGPCATTGTTTLPARRIASASAPSSGRCASKKIAKATTRGAAGRRASSASA